jgi:hypothetical protein
LTSVDSGVDDVAAVFEMDCGHVLRRCGEVLAFAGAAGRAPERSGS